MQGRIHGIEGHVYNLEVTSALLFRTQTHSITMVVTNRDKNNSLHIQIYLHTERVVSMFQALVQATTKKHVYVLAAFRWHTHTF